MAPLLRVANCLWASAVILALPLTAQNPPAANSTSHSNPVLPAVVQLLGVGAGAHGQNQECSATGFLVNEEGYILTNAHVVEKIQECLAKSPEAKIIAKFAPTDSAKTRDIRPPNDDQSDTARPNGGQARLGSAQPRTTNAASVSCDLVGLDGVRDLAVLKTERLVGTTATGVTEGSSPFVELSRFTAMPGTLVTVTGHPAFAWVALTQSGQIVARKNMALLERNAELSEVLVLDIPQRRGNSGSPVYLDAGGGVVGVVERQNSADTSQTLAVPIHYAIEFLNRLGVKWHATPK